jgi:hypothetical protein
MAVRDIAHDDLVKVKVRLTPDTSYEAGYVPDRSSAGRTHA